MDSLYIHNIFQYYQSGQLPRLLIHAGTHGDEYEVICCVTDAVKKFENVLPPFIYVPHVSPSGCYRKTRVNEYGIDLNRAFYSDSTDPEVQDNISILNTSSFDLLISFHEDPEYDSYYVYHDVCLNHTHDDVVLKCNASLKTKGIELLNGLDDDGDPDLRNMFIDGYKKFVHQEPDNGLISVWALNHHKAKEVLIPEIPGKVDSDTKKRIVDHIFSELIVPYFQY